MNLILLQPGDPDIIFGGTRYPATIGQGIDLSATANKYSINLEECLPLASFSQGLKQQPVSDAVNVLKSTANITCIRYADAYSVMLYEACMRCIKLGEGKERPTTIFMLGIVENKITSVLKVQLRDAIISSIELQGDTNNLPTNVFSIGFSEIIWESNILNNNGAEVGELHIGWSQLLNSPIASFSE